MVGCSICSVVCPAEGISFPSRDIVWKAEREYKIFKRIHGEAEAKREKTKTLEEHHKAEEQIGTKATRLHVRVAGVFARDADEKVHFTQ